MVDRTNVFWSQVTLAIVTIVAASALIIFHALLRWNDEGHAREECATIAEIATQLAQSSVDRSRTVEFSALLAGSPFIAWLPHREQSEFLDPLIVRRSCLAVV